jgi:hypothetical protein
MLSEKPSTFSQKNPRLQSGRINPHAEPARSAPGGEIPAQLHDAREEVLAALLENPHFDESHLCLLLERKDLPSTLLEAISRRKEWMPSYRVKRRIALDRHTPRLLALRLARELYLMDLVQLTRLPAAPAEVKRLAEELILARLPQLSLGQKILLARRGSARVAGGLILEGHAQVVRIALDNAFLAEAQVLKALSRERLPAPVVSALAHHPKWSHLYHVRAAVARHPAAPIDRVLSFLPHFNRRDLQDLRNLSTLSAAVRQAIREEIERRSAGKTPAPQGRRI